jgi:hypothetical protein
MSYNISTYTLSLSLSSASHRLAVSFFSWSPSVGPSLSVSFFLSLPLSLCLCVTSPVFLPSLFLLFFRVQIAIRAIVDDYESLLFASKIPYLRILAPTKFLLEFIYQIQPIHLGSSGTQPYRPLVKNCIQF